MSETSYEFSHPFDLVGLSGAPVQVNLQALTEDCAAIAERLGILRLDTLSASLELLPPGQGGHAALRGTIKAQLSQACVITLDPVPADLEVTLDVELMDEQAFTALSVEEDLIDAADRDVEPVQNGVVDLGELVVQYLSLALDPYPKSPGAELDDRAAQEKAAEDGPFAALSQLKDKTQHGT